MKTVLIPMEVPHRIYDQSLSLREIILGFIFNTEPEKSAILQIASARKLQLLCCLLFLYCLPDWRKTQTVLSLLYHSYFRKNKASDTNRISYEHRKHYRRETENKPKRIA